VPPTAATASEDNSDASPPEEPQGDAEAEVETEADEGAEAELELDELVRVWPAVLDKLRESSPALAATFEGARPVALDADVLRIGFPADSTFNKRKAEAPDKREQFAEALEAVAGSRLRPVYVILDGEEAAEGSGGEDVDHEALVEKLKSEFNAEEVGG
jgi:hypothetical protein